MPGKCARCLREVYFAEEKLALGKVWHAFCFSCYSCRKSLNSYSVTTYNEEIFCQNCYPRVSHKLKTQFASMRQNNVLLSIKQNDEDVPSPESNLSEENEIIRDYFLVGKESKDISNNYLKDSQRLHGGGSNEQEKCIERQKECDYGIENYSENISKSELTQSHQQQYNVNTIWRSRRQSNFQRSQKLEKSNNPCEVTSQEKNPKTISEQLKKINIKDQNFICEGKGNVVPCRDSLMSRRVRIGTQRGKPWTYPPLPPNHTPPKKKVSFVHEDEVVSSCNEYVYPTLNKNEEDDHVKKIVNKYNANAYDHECSDCESICMNENEFDEKMERNSIDVEELEESHNENEESRMRGGCGSGCSCAGEEAPMRRDKNDACCTRNQKQSVQDCCSSESIAKKYETVCMDEIKEHCPTPRCNPPIVNAPVYSCPASGLHPVCVKSPRCDNSPRRVDNPDCGGCCGSGCRAGCGKPGQLHKPLRATRSGSSCCRGQSSVRRSPSSLPKCDTPRPAASTCSKTQKFSRQTNAFCQNESECFTRQMINDECCDCKQLNRLKSGSECLGGGIDCQRCGRKVYQAEMMIAAGSPYHNICFSCYCCRKPLEPLTYQENCGEIYCKQCLIRNFGPQGYGYGLGAGALQTPI